MRIAGPMRSARLAIPSGPLAAIIVYIALPTAYADPDGAQIALDGAACAALAMATWMAVWWLTEALPVAATALLPLVAFPLLGLGTVAATAAPYAHPLIFLFLGGFLLSIAIQKWDLHRWVAGRVVAAADGDARRLVGGFMVVTAFASLWLSNTATTIMMLPIAVSLIARSETAGATREETDRFARCLLLAIAYAASIGGMGTLIGSPPNLFVASFIEQHFSIAVDFRRWMLMALPIVAVLLPGCWFLLTRLLEPIPRDLIAAGARNGPGWQELGSGARRTAVIFAAAVAAWVARPWLAALEIGDWRPLAALSDTGVAMAAGLLLFIVPSGDPGRPTLMSWPDAETLPVGTLLLFGGGLALAGAIAATGADRFIGAQLAGLAGAPPAIMITVIVSGVVFLTELTSNTATTATLAPVLAVGAAVLLLDPLAVVVVTALAASCAFMMPVATPPNAIVFSSGRLGVREMARAGLFVNVFAIVVITLAALWWLPRVLPSVPGT